MESKIEISDLQKILNDTQIEPKITNLGWDNKHSINKSYVLVTAPPKSGSTWTTNVLAKSLKYKVARYCYAWSSNEHDIYVPALLANQGFDTIAQMHMKGTPHNVQLILDFRINTIILTRNIYDSLISFSRDLKAKRDLDPQVPGLTGYSFVWTKHLKREWLQEDYIEYAIKYYLPWYINFLSSWSAYKDQIPAKSIRYELLRSKPKEVFEEIIPTLKENRTLYPDFGKQFTSHEISTTNSDTGSGLEILSTQQRQKIESYFCGIDDKWIQSHLLIDV